MLAGLRKEVSTEMPIKTIEIKIILPAAG